MLVAPFHSKSSPVPVETRDVFHVIVTQLEVKHLKIFLDPGGRSRLGNDDDIPLDLKADKDLCCSLIVLISDGL